MTTRFDLETASTGRPRPRRILLDRVLLLPLLLVAGTANAQAPTASSASARVDPQSRIAKVIVYSDRAQVTRTAAADCAKGETSFAGLPSTLDAKTLFAEVPGVPGAVLGVSFVEEATGPRPRAEALQKEILALDEKIAEKNQLLAASSEVQSRLLAFGTYFSAVWARQATTAKPPIPSWDAALDLLRNQAEAAARRQREAKIIILWDLFRKRAELRADLAAVELERRRTTYRATAHLRCTGQKNVSLSYVIPNATFTLAYQARADSRGRKVTLVAQALVAQGTGEDWSETSLFLSTANLERQNLPPALGKMALSTYKPETVKKVLTKRLEQRVHLDEDKRKSSEELKNLSGKDQAAAVGGGEPDRGLAMLLPVQKKVSVPGDGRKMVVTLESRTVAASFALETVPKLYPFVYQRLTFKNPFAFTLLPGSVELFRDQAFVGRGANKLAAPGESVSLSLGVESEILVERFTKREEFEGAGVFGSKKRLHHRYAIQVGNWTKAGQRIRVLENVPVSQASEVGVELTGDTTRASEWRKEDGILAWDLDLPARSKRTVVVGYTVTLPASYELEGF